MASFDGSAGKPTPSQAPRPPPHPQDPGITIALFEIGSLPLFCWGPLRFQKNKGHKVTGPQKAAPKFNAVLRELHDILRNIAGSEEVAAEAKECFKDIVISEDVSELREKIRGLGKVNKMLLKNLLFGGDSEREQNAKKEEGTAEDQRRGAREMPGEPRSPADAPAPAAREPGGPGHAEGAPRQTPPGLDAGGERRRLRRDMEQLLQQAEQWSEQHSELSELLRLCQQCPRAAADAQEPAAAPESELEEQVRRLGQDTYSLHLIAALLENECQILERRVEILQELQEHREHREHQEGLPDRPRPAPHFRPARRSLKPGEGQSNRPALPEGEGAFQKKSRVSRSLDVCLSKKARKNGFNMRLARRVLLGRRRPASSLR